MLRYAIVGVLAFSFTLSAFVICILEMPGEQSLSIVGGSILQLAKVDTLLSTRIQVGKSTGMVYQQPREYVLVMPTSISVQGFFLGGFNNIVGHFLCRVRSRSRSKSASRSPIRYRRGRRSRSLSPIRYRRRDRRSPSVSRDHYRRHSRERGSHYRGGRDNYPRYSVRRERERERSSRDHYSSRSSRRSRSRSPVRRRSRTLSRSPRNRR